MKLHKLSKSSPLGTALAHVGVHDRVNFEPGSRPLAISLEIYHSGDGFLRRGVEVIHPTEFDALIEASGAQSSGFQTGLADENGGVRMRNDPFAFIGWPNRHKLGCGAINGSDYCVRDQH
jgi:hypothetical protein